MKSQKKHAKIAVRDLRARKDVKGGANNNKPTNGGNTISTGGNTISTGGNTISTGGNTISTLDT